MKRRSALANCLMVPCQGAGVVWRLKTKWDIFWNTKREPKVPSPLKNTSRKRIEHLWKAIVIHSAGTCSQTKDITEFRSNYMITGGERILPSPMYNLVHCLGLQLRQMVSGPKKALQRSGWLVYIHLTDQLVSEAKAALNWLICVQSPPHLPSQRSLLFDPKQSQAHLRP